MPEPHAGEGLPLAPALVVRGITKRFAHVTANDDITLSVNRGEIHALLGENGAGKTTLMNILYGVYQPDAGEMLLDGRPYRPQSPADAIARGVGMVHQHFMLVPTLTVLENITLGVETTQGPLLQPAAARARIEELARSYGLPVDVNALVEDISVGQRQRVEILKALYRRAELLILDEPTAVLTPQEADELFKVLRLLTSQGKTVIFISHKLREVLKVSDRVTVIRQGRVVSTHPTAGMSAEGLAALMVGRPVSLEVDKTEAQPGRPLLEVRDLQVPDGFGGTSVRGVTFTVGAGEIVGIAGVDGNGQSELVEALAGLRKPSAGRVLLDGADITHWSTARRLEAGLAHIPEDRHARGLVLDFTLAENAVLGRHQRPPFARLGVFRHRQIEAAAQAVLADYDVRPPVTGLAARSLSGGNQQKLIVGRELSGNPKVLLAAQPTRGVDVGAMQFIHQRLIEHRDQGGGVLLVSMELDEILSLADRLLVMYEGRIVAELDPATTTEEEVGLYMAGAKEAGR